MTVYLIPEHGPCCTRSLPDDDSLHGLQALLDGPIEVSPRGMLNHRYLVLVNEEGLFHEDFWPNARASAISGTRLVGPAVVVGLGLVNDEPDFVGLTDSQVAYLDNLLA